MKCIKLIISVFVLVGLFVSLSGRIIRINYCFNEQKYTFQFKYTSDINSSHSGCRCESERKMAASTSTNNSCCSAPEDEETKGLCCLDVKADSNPDSYYTFLSFNPDLKPMVTNIISFHQPMDFDYFYTSTFELQKTRDHSPPQIIATQILLI